MALDKAKIREEVGRYIASKSWAKALEELQKLVILEARDPEIRVHLGDVQGALGNRTRAVEEYRKALKLLEKTNDSVHIVPLCKKILSLDSSLQDVEDLMNKYQAQTQDEPLQELVLNEEMPPIPLFSDLSEEEFKKVCAKAKVRKFPTEGVIVKEGESGSSIYFITSGEAKVFKKSKDEKQLLMDVLKEGDFFGEFGYFSDSKRHASVVASTEIEVMEISKSAFEDVIREFPRVSEVLVEFYKIRILDTLLALSPLFRRLKPQDRKQLISQFQLLVVNEGDEIIREGDPGDALFLIKSGVVEVFTTNPQGQKVVLAKLTEGEFFGEIALITGAPRTATVKALKETRLMKLNKEDFQKIAEMHPEVMDVARTSLEQRAEETISALMEGVKEQSSLV